jgi:hypothetical protein
MMDLPGMSISHTNTWFQPGFNEMVARLRVSPRPWLAVRAQRPQRAFASALIMSCRCMNRQMVLSQLRGERLLEQPREGDPSMKRLVRCTKAVSGILVPSPAMHTDSLGVAFTTSEKKGCDGTPRLKSARRRSEGRMLTASTSSDP